MPTCAIAAGSAAIAGELGLEVDPGHGAGKITTEIFERLCEDRLIQPTFVYDFPTEVSPLSKQKPDDPDTVERFELYIGGFEVANAFSELNDPVEQRRRFEAQLAEPRRRRPRGARDGRGLHPRARVRPAADRRRRRRHRSAGHAADQQPVDPRRHPVPADAESDDASESRKQSCDLATCVQMDLPFELHIALRYLLAKRKQAFISVISFISTLGVTVGVMALVIALALMTGLQQELRDRIVGSNPHIYVWNTNGIDDYRAEADKLRTVPHVLGAAPAIQGQGLLSAGDTQPVQIKGIDPVLEQQVTDLQGRDHQRQHRGAQHAGRRAAGHPARQGSGRQARRRRPATRCR